MRGELALWHAVVWTAVEDVVTRVNVLAYRRMALKRGLLKKKASNKQSDKDFIMSTSDRLDLISAFRFLFDPNSYCPVSHMSSTEIIELTGSDADRFRHLALIHCRENMRSPEARSLFERALRELREAA
jgi:hypothetical protein